MKFWRKSFSLLLALVIMLGAVPAYAFEEDKISSNEEYALSYHDVDFQPNNERAEDVDEISANKATSVPSKYSSVTSGNTAAVKNQNPYGTCWACSATAVCESSLITYAKDNGDENPDKTSLSVLQLVNYFYNSNRYDPLGNLNGDGTQNLIDTKLDEGGNNLFTMWGLASWVNGAPEAALPYQSPYLSQVNNNTVDTKYANDYDIAHLQNAYILPYSTDKNSQAQKDIKQAIIDYGAVACSYYHNDSYINSSNGAYYTTSTGTNHAVTIVGWNDDYPSSNFNKKPSGNGAWLVKNSWGSSWSNSTDGDAEAAHSGRQGYFWLSYYDASINSSGNVFAYLFEPIDNYKNNYQYDGSCGLQSTYVYDAAAIYQIKGLTSDYETIDAVGIGFNDTNVSGKIYIYLDPVNNNPKSGTLLTTQNFSVTFNGFHTIKIDDAPIVEKGHNISIVVIPSKTTTVYYDCTYQNSNWISFTANTTNDKTYKYTSSSSYTDFKSTGTLRIKAYTNDYISGERFTITYDGNGATSNVPDVLTKIEGKDCTISSQIPVKTGYTFMGWGNDASNPTKVYQPGDTYSDDASITLYAIWQIQTYTLKYNANGGSGAPAEQTKEYGKALTLSSTVPTRTGYVFKGWGTSASSTTASYQPGGTYTDNKAVTLYAVWQAETYTISYDANGGSGAPAGQTKKHGETLTLSTTKPTRAGYDFVGWATTSTSSTVAYQPGASYTQDADLKLYAVWKEQASVSVKDNGNYVIDAGDYKGTVTFLVVQRNDSGQILPGMTLQTFDLSQQSVIDGMLSSGKYELYLLDSSFAPLINVVNANVK